MNVPLKAYLVRIYVDWEACKSPSPTTGEALYELAGIPSDGELFREVSGDHEDAFIPCDGTPVDLKEDDHLISRKAVTVYVNGEAHETTKKRLSFDEVVKIAYPAPPSGDVIEFTVTYRNGPSANPKGTLTAGHSVKLKNKMIFDVTPTDRS